MVVDDKCKRVSTTSQVTMHTGASGITVNSGYAGLYYCGAVKFCYMDIQFTLTNANADYFSPKFSNVATYCTTDGSFSYGSMGYINMDVNNPQRYVLHAGKYGFRIMYNGSSIKGTDYTGSTKRFSGSVFFV